MTATAVQVWLLPLTEATGIPRHWAEHLDAGERQRAQRFLHDADRERFIAGRALIRALLAAAGGRPAARWQLATDAQGKPHVAGLTPAATPAFSISHTAGLVGAAVAPPGARVGIDIEGDHRRLSPGVARRVLAPEEHQRLTELDAAARPAWLLRRWVLKEALAKAVGTGLALPFPRVAFLDDDPPQPRFSPASDLGRPEDWTLQLQHQPSRHWVATAHSGSGQPPGDGSAIRLVTQAALNRALQGPLGTR